MTALGTTFVGVDDEALGDGDADAQTIDTWYQNRISSNIATCALIGRMRNLPPVISNADDFTTFAGIRPYPAIAWQTVWVGWVLVTKGDTAIRFSFAYQSDVPGSPASTAGAVEYLVSLGDGSSVGGEGVAFAGTYSGGIETGVQWFTIDLREQARTDDVLLCVVQTRAALDQADIATSHGSLGTGVSVDISAATPFIIFETQGTPNRFWSPNNTPPGGTTAPQGNSFESMIFEQLGGTAFENTAADQKHKHDLIFAEDNPGAGNTKAATVQTLSTPAQTPQSGLTLMSQNFFLRSLAVLPLNTFSNEKQMSAIRLAPNIEFSAREAQVQAIWTTELLRQWRVASLGPRGKKSANAADMDTIDYYGYAVHWPFVMGDYDNSTLGQETAVINEAFYLTTEDPIVELRCLWLCVQHGAGTANINFYDDLRREKTGNKGGIDQKIAVQSESNGPGRAVWDMTATIDQMDDLVAGGAVWDTDSTAYTGVTVEDIGLDVWGADTQMNKDGYPPVLRGSDFMEQGGKATGEEPSFWFKEGSLFLDHGDDVAGLLQQTSHEFNVNSTDATITGRPLRLKVEMDLDTFTDPLQPGYTTAAALNATLRLMLVGYVLLEKPRNG